MGNLVDMYISIWKPGNVLSVQTLFKDKLSTFYMFIIIIIIIIFLSKTIVITIIFILYF